MDIRKPEDLCLLLLMGGIGLLGLWGVLRFLRLWIMAVITETGIDFFDIIGMRLRKVDPLPIIVGKMMLQKSGCHEVTKLDLEAHVLAGGNVEHVVRAMAKARTADVNLDWKTACEMDRKGKDVIEYIESLSGEKKLGT